MRTVTPMLFMLLLSFVSLAAQEVDTAWVRAWDSPGHLDDAGLFCLVDTADNILTVGLSGTGNYDYREVLVAKFNSEGDTLWVRRHAIAEQGWVTDAAMDTDGSIVITGVNNYGQYDNDLYLIKFSPDGELLWDKVFYGPENGWDLSNDIAIDDHGNVYMAGQVERADTYNRPLLVKYNSNGDSLWAIEETDCANWSYPNPLILLLDNQVVMCTVPGDYCDRLIRTYDTTGVLLWEDAYSEHAIYNAHIQGLVVDSAGDIVLVAIMQDANPDGTGYDYMIYKYSSAGGLLWYKRFDGVGTDRTGDVDVATEVAVGQSNSLVICGHSTPDYDLPYDGTVLKLDQDGTVLGEWYYDGTGGDDDYFWGLALDSVGNILVSGQTTAGDGTAKNCATFKLSPDLEVKWQHFYDGSAHFEDGGNDLVLDSRGNAVITGYTNSAFSEDHVLIKYREVPFSVVDRVPEQHSYTSSDLDRLELQVNYDIDPATVSDSIVLVKGQFSGRHDGAVTLEGSRNIACDLQGSFLPGEVVAVTVTRGMRVQGELVPSFGFNWSFTVSSETSTGMFASPQISGLITRGQQWNYSSRAQVIDLNDDGLLDGYTVASDRWNPLLITCMNQGNLQFQVDSTLLPDYFPDQIYGAIIADSDRDSLHDMIVVDFPSTFIMKGESSANGFISWDTLWASPLLYQTLQIFDFNADGFLDIAGQRLLYINDGTGRYGEPHSFWSSNGTLGSLDANGDDFIDLIAEGDKGFLILLNDGDGNFRKQLDYILGEEPKYVFTSDLSGDGVSDVVVIGEITERMYILIGNGDGTFELRQQMHLGSGYFPADVGDIDGDDDADIAGVQNRELVILRNSGQGTFSDTQAERYDLGGRTVSQFRRFYGLYDIDGDGALDFVAADTSDLAFVLRNLSTVIAADRDLIEFTVRDLTLESAVQKIAITSDSIPIPITYTFDSEWLKVQADTAFTPTVLNLSVNVTDLPYGEYSDTIRIEASLSDNGSLQVPVNLRFYPEEADLIAYPVPVSLGSHDHFSLRINAPFSGRLVVSFFNSGFTRVHRQESEIAAGEASIEVDVSRFVPGVYLYDWQHTVEGGQEWTGEGKIIVTQ